MDGHEFRLPELNSDEMNILFVFNCADSNSSRVKSQHAASDGVLTVKYGLYA